MNENEDESNIESEEEKIKFAIDEKKQSKKEDVV